MKKIFILLSLFIVVFSALSQNNANDTIFSNRWEITGPCNIQEIQVPNKVLFKINEKDSIMKAIAIIRNDEFINLKTIAKLPEALQNIKSIDSLINLKYNDHSYFQYLYHYNKAQKSKRTGMVLTLAGLGGAAIGGLTIHNASKSSGYSVFIGGFIMAGGLTVASVGTPIWIISSQLSRNNLKAMKKCKNPNTSLILGFTRNGIGLVYRF